MSATAEVWQLIFGAFENNAKGGSRDRHLAHSSDRATSQREALGQADSTLLTRLRDGDVDALRIVMAQHWEHLATMATIITRSSDLAREAVQDAFVQTWEARATLDVTRNIRGYLTTVASRRARDLIRRERVQTRLAHTVAAHLSSSAVAVNAGEQAIASAELGTRIEAVLQALPPRCREIFLLRRKAHLSNAEIAAMLGVSNATVRNQMSRALQAIAQAVGDWHAGE